MAEEYDFIGGQSEREALEDVIKAVGEVHTDSKWQTFQDLIRQGGTFREDGDRILIFTQYRVTQSWLAEKLTAAGEKVMQIHGGLNLDERREQRLAFDGHVKFLFYTD